MILGNWFIGDSQYIQRTQNRLYLQHIWHLYTTARSRYMEAQYITGEVTQLWRDTKDIKTFVHKPLQEMHDTIAAQFRYNNLEALFSLDFPSEIDAPPNDALYSRMWIRYFCDTFDEITKRYPSIIRCILTTITYQKPDQRGVDAEDRILVILQDFYPLQLLSSQ